MLNSQSKVLLIDIRYGLTGFVVLPNSLLFRRTVLPNSELFGNIVYVLQAYDIVPSIKIPPSVYQAVILSLLLQATQNQGKLNTEQ